VTHIWTTISCRDPFHLRKLVLRMWWDGETEPSVEAPVGDFFGLGHAQHTYFVSLPLQMFDRGFNCWFPMPFARGARITIQNESDEQAVYYYYVDYEPVRQPGERRCPLSLPVAAREPDARATARCAR